MKINEFVEMYKKNRNIDFKKVLDVTEYIGIAYKKKIAELVLDSCMTEENGILQVNSLDRYLLFTVAVIGAHTNLDFSDDDNEEYSALDDFDTLNKNKLLEKIIDTFKADYDACQIVLDMMTSDKIKNHDTLEKKICRFLNALSDEAHELDNIENKNEILGLLTSIIEA